MNFKHNNVDDLVDNFDYPKPLNRDPNVYGLLGVFGEELNRIDLDIEHLYDQRFIATASGRELEKLAKMVGVKRRDGETDEHLRRRVYAEYVAQRSDTTYDVFGSAVKNITGASANQFAITTPPDSSADKVIHLSLQSSVLDDSVLSQSEIAYYLNRVVSADARVEIFLEGSFGFAGDTDNKGFDSGTWSSTIS